MTAAVRWSSHLARPSITLGTTRLSAFDPRGNAITPVRLALALTVLVSHSFTIGGFGPEPLVIESRFTASAGFIAVLAFFTLSGFLIASSRERTPVLAFLRNRALRIFPGYWLSLVFVALLAAPAAAALQSQELHVGDQLAYVLPRLAFLPGSESGIREALGGARINGSLWTLPVELLCYLMLAAAPARLIGHIAAGEAVLLLLLFLGAPSLAGPETGLMFAFVLGVMAWRWRARVPIGWIGAACAVVVGIAGVSSGTLPLMAASAAYLALCSAWLPIRLDRDLSYGVYVLAYPTQTLLVIAGLGTSVALLIGASIAVVLPLAWLSWTFVERPAMRLRHLRAPVIGSTRPATDMTDIVIATPAVV